MSREEKMIKAEKGSTWFYNWIFWSSLITVPWMGLNLINQGYTASSGSFVWAVSAPVFIHLVLLIQFDVETIFTKRHRQQAFMLLGLRLFSAMFFFGTMNYYGICGWFLVNGGIWLWGWRWGLGQVKKGDCWLIRFLDGKKGKKDLPRAWAFPSSPSSEAKIEKEERKALPSLPPASVEDKEMEMSKVLRNAFDYLNRGQKDIAIRKFYQVFRDGSGNQRALALVELEKLEQVESF